MVWLVTSMEKMFPFCVVVRDPKRHQLKEMFVGSRKVSGAKGPVAPVSPFRPVCPVEPWRPVDPVCPIFPLNPWGP